MTKWKDLPAGDVNAAFQRFMVALGDDADVAIKNINTIPAFVERLVLSVRNDGVSLSLLHQRERMIMRENFFGVEEAIKHFGVNPSGREIAILAEVPFSEETLRACRDTHVLVAMFPMSITDMKLRYGEFFYDGTSWYSREAFATEQGNTRWCLIRKTSEIKPTTRRSPADKHKLGRDETLPTARMVVYTTIAHFLSANQQLFHDYYVRCLETDRLGNPIFIGRFGRGRIRIHDPNGGNDGDSYLYGIASAKK